MYIDSLRASQRSPSEPLRSPPDGQPRSSLLSALGRSMLSVRVTRRTLTSHWHKTGRAREEVMSVKGRQMTHVHSHLMVKGR